MQVFIKIANENICAKSIWFPSSNFINGRDLSKYLFIRIANENKYCIIY